MVFYLILLLGELLIIDFTGVISLFFAETRLFLLREVKVSLQNDASISIAGDYVMFK